MTRPTELVVAKMHGAANDFCVVAGAPPTAPDDATLVRALADRRTGIGADGVLFVERDGADRVRMHFYNRDGGRAGLCLNGSRCVALHAVLEGWTGPTPTIATEHQSVAATVLERDGDRATVRLEVDRPRSAAEWIDLPEGRRGARVHTGDPHLVVEVDAATIERDFEAAARELRHFDGLGPEGANVHFVHRGGDPWIIRSFERGVEAETLACGRGCISATAALGDGPVALRTRGGAVLRVDPRGERWTLTGPAERVFVTEWRR